MPVNTRELINAISVIANEQNVRVTFEHAAKGALICGASALVGGLLLGPRGLALGGALGGLAALAATDGEFRSLGDVLLNDLSHEQQQELVTSVENALAPVGLSDLTMLVPLIMRDSSVQGTVLNTAINFVTRNLDMQIIRN